MDITGIIRIYFFSWWQIIVMAAVDSLISVWAFYSIIIMTGIFFYETMVLDVSFDTEGIVNGEEIEEEEAE